MFSILFPGQGSQYPGMGQFLFNNFQIAKEVFEEASEAIKLDLKRLCFSGSDSELALTENTQPCLLVTSVATQSVLKKQMGVSYSIAAGHSIGEYAALVTAEAIPFASAMQAVRIRGQAMQSAVPVGAGGMFAVMGLDQRQIEQMCQYIIEKSGFGPLSPANYNSPGQIVISGNQKALDWLKNSFKPEELWPEIKRVKLIPLQVSAPFHCAMMKPAEDRMRSVLSEIEFKKANFPIIQNFTAQPVVDETLLRENLIRQISAPVLWMQSMETLKNWHLNKPISCIEAGAGRVLQGLLKKIDSEVFQVFNTNSLEDLETIEKKVKGT